MADIDSNINKGTQARVCPRIQVTTGLIIIQNLFVSYLLLFYFDLEKKCRLKNKGKMLSLIILCKDPVVISIVAAFNKILCFPGYLRKQNQQ